MEYRNTITGAIIETKCEINGGAWEPVKAPKPSTKKAPTKKTKE